MAVDNVPRQLDAVAADEAELVELEPESLDPPELDFSGEPDFSDEPDDSELFAEPLAELFAASRLSVR